MFGAFKKALPQISIFHNPASPPSTRALELLRASLSGPYPPGARAPLAFDLEVVEHAPTADQLRTVLGYLSAQRVTPLPASTLLSAHPAADAQPTTTAGVARLIADNPNALKWPVVVDWTGGRASVGDVEGVRNILEEVRRLRDGEAKGEEEMKPKGWFS